MNNKRVQPVTTTTGYQHRPQPSASGNSRPQCARGRHTAIRLTVSLLMTALIAAPTFAKSGSSAASGDTKAATHTSNTARATLDNGLQVVAVANHLAPAVTTVMNYHVGSRQAPSGFPGMAHAQEHMMFRGTAKLSAAQISAIAAGMGGRFNASTQDELTQYYFSVPSKYLDVALHLQAARMKSVANKPEAWHKERGAIKKEVGRDLSNPGYVAYKKLREQLFHGTPYSHDALGTKPSFDKTTASMLNKFHDTWYAPNNATLVIAGDIKPEHVIDQVRHLFSSIQKKKLPKRTDLQFSPVKTKPIRMKTDRGQGMAYLAFRTPGTSDQKRYASLKVLTKILNDPRGRLYSQLVATGQSLGTSFATRGMRDAGIGFAAASFAKGADSKALVKKLKNVLSTIAEQGVTEQQVTAAKRQIKTAAAAAEDSISGQAQRWSRTVAMHQYQSPQALIQRIDRVDVERVNQLAKKLLAENAHVLTVLTPGKSDDATASSGFGGKESFTPKHVGKVKLPSWAAKPLQSIQAPAPTVQPQTTTLDNGMKLVTITTASTQATHVYGQIRNNPALTAPEGQAGVDSVLSRLLDFGTETHDRRAYQAALNRIGASSSAGTSFSLTVLPRHFQKGLSLLAEKQLQPALPAKAFPIVQRQIASAVAGQNQSPGFLAKQALKEGLYPKNDPSLRHATPKSVKSLTQGDVTSYYHKVFRPDLTTLVVVSSLPPQKVKQAVTKQFGDWSAKGNPPTVALDPVPANKPHRAQVDDSAKSQDEVALAQTLDVANKSRARHALQLGEQVLTGSFYASRLYRELRAERGLVYTIGSNINLSPKRATLSFQFGAAPEHVEQADQIIRETLTNMAEEPINTEDLHRARAGLIRQIPLQAASASSIGNGILRRERLDLPLDAPYRAADDYLDIGAKTIQQAFKTYVRPNDLVRIVQGPAPVDDN